MVTSRTEGVIRITRGQESGEREREKEGDQESQNGQKEYRLKLLNL